MVHVALEEVSREIASEDERSQGSDDSADALTPACAAVPGDRSGAHCELERPAR